MKVTDEKFNGLLKEMVEKEYTIPKEERVKERIWNQIQAKKPVKKRKNLYPLLYIGIAALLFIGVAVPRLQDKMSGATENTLTNINQSFSDGASSVKNEKSVDYFDAGSPFNVPSGYVYIGKETKNEDSSVYTYKENEKMLVIEKRSKKSLAHTSYTSLPINNGTLFTVKESKITTFIYQKNDVQWVMKGQINEREIKKIVESIK